jgi:hypothetical protein
MSEKDTAKIVMVGEKYDYHGRWARVGMVARLGGERYYWLVFDDGSVAMLPAMEIERR